MSLLPVITPRTSEPLRQQRAVFQVNSDQTQLQNLYDRLSTGRRVISGSDDPAAAARAIGLKGGISHAEQMVRNASVAASFLATADGSLNEIDAALIQAQGTAVSAAQNVISDDEREAYTSELEQIIRRVMMSGNDAFRQSPLFGGALLDGDALELVDNSIIYHGNEAVSQPALARGTFIETVTTGIDALGLAQPVVNGASLDSALTRDTQLSDVRSGLGVSAGIIRLNDGSGWVDVDLRGAVTVGDLVDRIEATPLGERSLRVTVGVDSLTFEYADGLQGTLGIDDAPGYDTSKQLNIHNPLAFTAPPIVGGGLAPKTTLLTPLSDLNEGAGIDVSAGIQIRVDDEITVIDLSTAQTVDDVVTAINRSGAFVRAELNPTTEAIQLKLLKSGADYSVGENGGQAATDLGLRTANAETSLSSLRNGRGSGTNANSTSDLTIRRPDGTNLNIVVDGLETIADVINAINTHTSNQDTRRITASLNSQGNGITLTGPVDTLPIRVTQPANSAFGTALGLIPEGEEFADGIVSGGISVMIGDDYKTVEPEGALDTLLRMRDAIANGDNYDLERLSSRLGSDLDRASRMRGELGFRSQTTETLRFRSEDLTVTMKERLSDEIDADFADTISQINTRQAALEASLRVLGQTAGLTVLNFL